MIMITLGNIIVAVAIVASAFTGCKAICLLRFHLTRFRLLSFHVICAHLFSAGNVVIDSLSNMGKRAKHFIFNNPVQLNP